MDSFEVTPDLLPAISAGMSAKDSSLQARWHTVAPYMVPAPTGAHAPGMIMTGAFAIAELAFSTLVDDGIIKSNLGGAHIEPAAVIFEGTDTVGSVVVKAADTVAASAFGS
ncbi:hypothetical protein [Nocardia sp. NPDC019395]|uniref:hypothetical protein n=1 Tax=Nocardia sp. NPDC019395 TaxID=3154686 RepID=UPI0033CD2719